MFSRNLRRLGIRKFVLSERDTFDADTLYCISFWRRCGLSIGFVSTQL